MKSCLSGVFLLLSALLLPAATLLNETFNYSDGSLVTLTTNWSTYSGTTGQIQVLSGHINLSKNNSEDVHTFLAGQPYPSTTNTVLYASFTINFTTLPSSSGSYFAMFKDGGGSNFRDRIFATTSGAGTGFFRIGVANAGTVSTNYPADLSTNTSYTVVVRYGISNATSTLWINPTAESDTHVTATDSATAISISTFALREDGSGGTIGTFSLDNLLVGTVFSDAVTNGAATPPSIVTHPQSQTLSSGATANFSVAASGSSPLNYQWLFNGSAISGATTTSLSITNVGATNSGTYSAVVTNSAGSITSSPALLIVITPVDQTAKLTYMTYNVKGNGVQDWSTNTAQVQAIGRELMYLNPDIITFNEIPTTNLFQMTNWVKAFLPGYYLATNSTSDGSIRATIASRYPITRSTAWLAHTDLNAFGYTNSNFTRDLFEAQISVPNYQLPLHVFVLHLKATTTSPQDDANKRGAEAACVSNFFVNTFLPGTNGTHPYIVSGDMNEDIYRPDTNSYMSAQPIQTLVSSPTGLRLTTPVNPFTGSDLTESIQSSLNVRFDYILPCGLMWSNMVTSQIFRTDLLNPAPGNLQQSDDKTASDHLPVLMYFNNPYDVPFNLNSIKATNSNLTLNWQSTTGRVYRVESSSNLVNWTTFATNLSAAGTNFVLNTNGNGPAQFFRVYRQP